VYENRDIQWRITEAKRVTERVVDHVHYLLDIHENNAVVIYSDTLSKQIPKSYAANAFNVFREAMHQIEVVRLCALWDQAHIDHETITTIIGLIEGPGVIEALAEEARAQYGNVSSEGDKDLSEELKEAVQKKYRQFGDEHATKATAALSAAIQEARALRKSPELTSIRNLRNKHIAHHLTQSKEEKESGPIEPMRHGDDQPLLEKTVSIVEALYCWVNGVGLSFKDSQAIDRKYADALWKSCTFSIPSR
jgi:hypothetical protein